LLAVLMLRGPQTLGELRSRTGRYVEFADLDDVSAELAMLAAGEEPRTERLDRRPGEKESRYRHLLGREGAAGTEERSAAVDVSDDVVSDTDRVGELESELAELRERVTRMERELGLDL
jgi:hypothetical protein